MSSNQSATRPTPLGGLNRLLTGLLGWLMLLTASSPSVAQPPLLPPQNPPLVGPSSPLGAQAPDNHRSSEEVTKSSPIPKPSTSAAAAEDDFNRLLTAVAREQIPHTFSDDGDWGLTDTRWDGLRVEREGWRIKTKRRRKEVNHGQWKRVDCILLNPHREFTVKLSNIRQESPGRMLLDVDIAALLNVQGRVARWVKGVQLYSLSAEANARVRLKLTCALSTQLQGEQLPPDLLLKLAVTEADLELQQFDVYRVSKLGGEVADQLGKVMRGVLEKKIDERRERLVEKLNRAIEKRQDRLRLSVHDAWEEDLEETLTGWWRSAAEPPLKTTPAGQK